MADLLLGCSVVAVVEVGAGDDELSSSDSSSQATSSSSAGVDAGGMLVRLDS